MSSTKQLFKYTGEIFFGYYGELFEFKSVEEINKQGKRIPKWKILIDKKHPIFANIQLKYWNSVIEDDAKTRYEITFDSEKGKKNLNTGGDLEDNGVGENEKERHFTKDHPITLTEKSKDNPNGIEREREREQNCLLTLSSNISNPSLYKGIN